MKPVIPSVLPGILTVLVTDGGGGNIAPISGASSTQMKAAISATEYWTPASHSESPSRAVSTCTREDLE